MFILVLPSKLIPKNLDRRISWQPQRFEQDESNSGNLNVSLRHKEALHHCRYLNINSFPLLSSDAI